MMRLAIWCAAILAAVCFAGYFFGFAQGRITGFGEGIHAAAEHGVERLTERTERGGQ